MFDDSDIAFHNLFGNIVRNKVVFNRKELRFCTYLMDCLIKKIALGRCDFSDCPIAVADIFLCYELSVAVGHILIHKCFAFVNTVNCTGEFCVALSSSFFSVALCNGNAELLQNICEITVCNLIPFNRCCLLFRNNIADCCIHFFERIWRASADKHIFECCNTVFVGNCVLINGNACKRSTVKVESHTLYKIIFRGLDNLKITSFENVVEVYGCHLTGNNGYSVNFLRNIFINGLFRYGIYTGHKIIKLKLTAVFCGNSLINSIPCDSEFDTVNLSVLTGLYNLTRTVADFHFYKAFHRVTDILTVRNDILNTVTGRVFTVRPNNNTLASAVCFGCGNCKLLAGCFCHRNSQLISAFRKSYTVNIGRKLIITKHTVCICKSSNILTSVPFEFIHLCRTA